jgi:hypothetical protein
MLPDEMAVSMAVFGGVAAAKRIIMGILTECPKRDINFV